MCDKAPDLSIIIVSWNVRELLRACLKSGVSSQGSVVSEPSSVISPQSLVTAKLRTGNCELKTEIIVVDNASSDGSAATVAAEFPSVQLIANPDNRGFTRGNNQGLALARGRYVLFLNPDTVVAGDALETMVAYMDAHSGVGALGPQLRYGDGSPQSSKRRFPTLTTALFESTPLAWHWPPAANPWARHYRMEDDLTPSTPSFPRHRRATLLRGTQAALRGKGDGGIGVDWLVGAALLVRREVLDQIGGFDEGYFMYSEELDLCRRIKQAGWQIVHLPQAEVIHYEGKSSEQAVAARHIRFQTSRVRYFRKFHGPLAAETLRLALLGMFAVEWLLEAGKWLLGSKRSLRQQRMAAYGELLKSGLR